MSRKLTTEDYKSTSFLQSFNYAIKKIIADRDEHLAARRRSRDGKRRQPDQRDYRDQLLLRVGGGREDLKQRGSRDGDAEHRPRHQREHAVAGGRDHPPPLGVVDDVLQTRQPGAVGERQHERDDVADGERHLVARHLHLAQHALDDEPVPGGEQEGGQTGEGQRNP